MAKITKGEQDGAMHSLQSYLFGMPSALGNGQVVNAQDSGSELLKNLQVCA